MNTQKITGFVTVSEKGRIENRCGYFYAWNRPGVKFNLPPGNYNISGNLARLKKPVRHPKIKAPRHKVVFQPDGKIPTGLAVNFYGRKTVHLSEYVKKLPQPVRAFIYAHEIGHLAGYWEEEDADRYAIRYMLSEGYNPSQIWVASLILGFDPDRKQKVRNYLTKHFER